MWIFSPTFKDPSESRIATTPIFPKNLITLPICFSSISVASFLIRLMNNVRRIKDLFNPQSTIRNPQSQLDSQPADAFQDVPCFNALQAFPVLTEKKLFLRTGRTGYLFPDHSDPLAPRSPDFRVGRSKKSNRRQSECSGQ